MRVPFDPPAGLISDDTVYAAPGAWADIDNMRYVEGRPQTVGGVTTVLNTALTGVCRSTINWTNISGVANVAFGTHSALQVYVGGVLATITPPGLLTGSIDASGAGPGYGTGPYGSGTYSVPSAAYNLRTWALDSWGETLLAVPRGGTLYQWSNNMASPATAIANAPDEINAMVVTAERQTLALGCNEEVSNDFNALCIRGCDIEDLSNWTTATDNNAFEHILEGGGQIVTGRIVGVFVGIWTDNALHQGQFLGLPDQTYRFDLIDENCGAIGANAVCVLKGVAYWVGKDKQIRAWAPGTRPAIIPCPIWSEFSESLVTDQAEKIVTVTNSRFDEVWFYYPDKRDGNENSRYIAFSVTTGTWFRGTIARTAACDSGVLSHPIAVTASGTAYYHDVGEDIAANTIAWRAKSAAQYLDEAERALQVQGMQPDFKDQSGTISLTIHSRMRPQGSTRTNGPYLLSTGAGKSDFRLTGKIIELEFSGVGYARFGKPTFDAVPTGSQ